MQQSCEKKECFKDIKSIKSQRQPSTLKKSELELNTQTKKNTTAKSALSPDVLAVISLRKAGFYLLLLVCHNLFFIAQKDS